MRPAPWSPSQVPTLWLDGQGQGVTDDGAAIRVAADGLAAVLDVAHSQGAGRVMLTETPPVSAVGHWLLVPTPGWVPRGHWLGSPPTGRFTHEASRARVEVRTAAEWFGSLPLRPAEARAAMIATAGVLGAAVPGAELFMTPAATGTNAWALSLPRGYDPEQVTSDIAQEIHRTSGQHHFEHLVTGPSSCECGDCIPLIDADENPTISEFSYVDGRFMYSALCRELGTGPGVRLRRDQAWDLVQADPYARARLLVRATVPEGWHHVGVLPAQHGDGWHYPNRPGTRIETWLDAAEVAVARAAGWDLDLVEGIAFRRAKPLDVWAGRLVRARERVATTPALDETTRRAVSAALRAILIQAIGAFASRGRAQTQVVSHPDEVPPQYRADVQRYGGLYAFRVPTKMSQRNQAFYHPELAAQVWARGRARVLSGPLNTGALHVSPSTLVGINGDAIYTTKVPRWSLPVVHGGADDGRVGRLRLQGVVRGNFDTPTTIDERDALRTQAEAAGPTSAWEAEQ